MFARAPAVAETDAPPIPRKRPHNTTCGSPGGRAARGAGTVPAMENIEIRKTFRMLEAVHGMIYFTPEGPPAYAAIGLKGARMGYFASRAAAMGAVPAEVVISTFFNFEPSLVRRQIPEAWRLATPAEIVGARMKAVDASLRKAFSDDVLDSLELAEAVSIARRAAMIACERPEGRPLFAAHSSLPWPDEPHLALWHAQTLLREYRGDGHIAALVGEGLSGVEALVSHAASGDVPEAALKMTRAWSDEAWSAAVEGMRARGLLTADDAPTFSDAGREQRQRIEDRTDIGAAAPYEAVGADACARLRELGKPLSQMVIDAGLLVMDPRRLLD